MSARTLNPKDNELAEALGGLAHPVRLAILRRVRQPRTLKEIDIRVLDDGGHGRVLARQTVKAHVDQLVALGLVQARDSQREYGVASEYMLDPSALFVLSELFRDLARLRPIDPVREQTLAGDVDARAADVRGPCLVVAGGLDVGCILDLSRNDGDRWTVGRRRDADVSVEHDPYVSMDNTVVFRSREGWWIHDHPLSRNGTTLNSRPVPKDRAVSLFHGDVIGIGRTLLVFRDDAPRQERRSRTL